MLPFNIYYQTLAAIGDPANPEWKATAAGLVVLRLISDWLDFGIEVIPSHSANFLTAKQLIAQIPNEKRVKPILAQVVKSLELAEQNSLRLVTPTIINYTDFLARNDQFSFVEEALTPFFQRAMQGNHADLIVPMSSQLAYATRCQGKLDIATEYYHTTIYYARATNDLKSLLGARCGESKAITERGDFSLADTITADTVKTAEKFGDPYLLAPILCDRAHCVITNGDYETGRELLLRALPFTEKNREFALADIAATLSGIGRFAEARRMSLWLAATAQAITARLQAAINLVYITYEEGDEQAFNLHRAALEFAPLKPWFAIAFRKFSAEGLRVFNHEEEADLEIEKARAIARKHHIHVFHTQEGQGIAK